MAEPVAELLELLEVQRLPSVQVAIDTLLIALYESPVPVDTALLLDRAIQHPGDCALLLPVLRAHGTADDGNKLFARYLRNGQLAEDAPCEVLEAIGFLGYQPAAPVLWAIARDRLHGESRSAALGLMDLDCGHFADDIAATLHGYGNRPGLFPEFVPALAFKTGRSQALQDLLKLRENTNINNIGGIIVGIAAFGKAGTPYFEGILTEPEWAAHEPATGAARALATGFYGLGLRPADLCARIRKSARKGADERKLGYMLACLLALCPKGVITANAIATPPRALSAPREPAAVLLDALLEESDGTSIDELCSELGHYQGFDLEEALAASFDSLYTLALLQNYRQLTVL